jgi:hypothetical protein
MEWVYILSNEKYLKGILKIGKTKKHPEVRADQVSNPTGVVGKFIVEWAAKYQIVLQQRRFSTGLLRTLG